MKFLVFGGGGKVARHFARLASAKGDEVISVVRNEDHSSDLKELGAQPRVLSLEDCTVPDLITLLTDVTPDAIVFAAGAGGKGDKARTRKVDYEGAVKVFDAMETANVKRLLYVGAMDIRDREKAKPEWYTSEDDQMSERMWKAIPDYMQAKYDAEVELHARKQLAYTVVRPGGLTLEPVKGATMGRTALGKTSRELVAQVLLAAASEPKTEGMTIDVLDGDDSVEGELQKVVRDKLDSWTG